MRRYEGVVSSLTANDKAEVIIRPGTPGIPGAPELTAKVCHCPTDGSTLRIEVLNRVGAEVGDWVSLARRSGMLMRSAVALLGIPVFGGTSGLLAGLILTYGFGVHVTGAVVSAAAGLLLGVIFAGISYKRFSADNHPVISHVIKSRAELASLVNDNQSCLQSENVACGSCLQRFP